jgi:hypothetical protein
MLNRKVDGLHASYFLAFQQCLNCKDTIYVAVGATPVPGGVLFKWHCDLCDHQFETVQSPEEGAAA